MKEILNPLPANIDSVDLVNEALNLRAVEIDFRTDPRWEPFVAAHPNGTIYHTRPWLEALEKEYGHKTVTLACESGNGELRAVLPLAYTRGLPLRIGGDNAARRLSSLPRTPMGGPLSIDRLGNAVVVRAAIDLVKQNSGTRLQLKTNDVELDGLVDCLDCTPWRLTYILQFPDRPQDLRVGSSRNRHRILGAVNKAAKEGVQIRVAETEDDLQAWYQLYLETMRRNTVPPRPYRFFESLWRSMRSGGLMELVLAEQFVNKRKKLLAGSIFLMYGNTVSYAFTGVQRKDLSLHPNDALIWHAIHKACQAGYRFFDFGEVPEGNTGLAAFKSKWGAQPTKLIRYYYPPLKQSVSDESDGRYYRLAKAVWQRLPLRVTAWLGDWLYGLL